MSDFILCGPLNDLEITRYLGSPVSVPNSFIPPINCIGLILIRSNKMQQYTGIYLLQNHPLRVSDVHRTHHQENIKL